MATYSTNLALTLLADGEGGGTWGQTTNANMGTLLEQAISGYQVVAMPDSNLTITIPLGASGTARNMYLDCQGALTATRNLIVPTNKKLYFVANNCTGGSIKVLVSGQTGVTLPVGARALLVCNGTDVVSAVNYVASATIPAITGAAITSSTINSTTIGATTPSTGAFTTLSATGGVSFSGTLTGAGFTALFASPPPIGGTVAAAGTFTTLVAGGLNVTSATIPANGIYLGAANTLRLSTNGIQAISISSGQVITLAQDLAITEGGTGSSTAAGARTNLGLVAIASSGSAADLTSGVLADARVQSSNVTQYSATLFTSPALTGTPTAPTQAVGNTSTRIATTAFVDPDSTTTSKGHFKLSNGIIMNWGVSGSIGAGGTSAQTYDQAYATATYSVVMTQTAAGGGAQSASNVESASTTGFTIRNSGSNSQAFYWVAYGK